MGDASHYQVFGSRFVVGDCNREAAAAVEGFVASVGVRQQPPLLLLLSGPSGSGKTTLLAALRDRLGHVGVEALWLTGSDLVDRTVESVRHASPDQRTFFSGADVVVIDDFGSLPVPSATALEAMWRVRHAVESGTVFAIAETSVQGHPVTPAIATFLHLVGSDAPIHRIAPLDPATRRELIRLACQRRRLNPPASVRSLLDASHLETGAEIEGAVAALHALDALDPTSLASVCRGLRLPHLQGAGLYERRLLLNVTRSLPHSPHDTLGVEPRDFRDMVIAWLLRLDLEATAATVSRAVGRSDREVRALWASMARYASEPVVQHFVQSVRP